jgi:type 1 glutamine amidotransferase
MRQTLVTAAALGLLGGVIFAACDDGSNDLTSTSTSATSTSGGTSVASTGSPGSTGVSGSSPSGSTSGNGEGQTSGDSTSGSGTISNSGSPGGSGDGVGVSGASSGASPDGAVASGGSPASSGSAPGTDPYSGSFKVLVLSKTLGFHHDSIPGCQQMLRELGRCVDAASCAKTSDTFISAAKPGSSFTVDVSGAPAGCPELPSATIANNAAQYLSYQSMGCDGSTTDLSDFSSTNLDTSQFSSPTAAKGPYQMIFFCSPTGDVFTSGGANGMAGMTAIQNFIQAGGAYGGLHAATDFNDDEVWGYYYNTLLGAHFVNHNNDGTAGTIITTATGMTHPIMAGIPNPWQTADEWYFENREISSQPGFQILATIAGLTAVDPSEPANDIRPMVWIRQFPVANNAPFEGRMFYTPRGHNITRYGEVAFRQLSHQGILWAANRLN